MLRGIKSIATNGSGDSVLGRRGLVDGGGGFMGGDVGKRLKDVGYWVRGADSKEHGFAGTAAGLMAALWSY